MYLSSPQAHKAHSPLREGGGGEMLFSQGLLKPQAICKNLLGCLQVAKHLLASASTTAGPRLPLLLKEIWKAKNTGACALLCCFRMCKSTEGLESGFLFYPVRDTIYSFSFTREPAIPSSPREDDRGKGKQGKNQQERSHSRKNKLQLSPPHPHLPVLLHLSDQ